jgi:thiol:disulfide interchange protein DsbD
MTSRFASLSEWIKRGIGLTLVLASLFYANILYGMTGTNSHRVKHDGFLDNLKQAKSLAQKQQKPLLIDFFADWCIPCHEWSDKVFADAGVKTLLQQKYVAVKIDCTTNTKECEEAVEEFGVVGWPTLIFVGADLHEIPDRRLVGYVLSPSEFKKYLEEMVVGVKP